MLQQLRGDDAFPQVGGEGLTVASDLLLFHGGDYYFVKPLVRRLWLATAAAQDAWRIVQTVRSRSRQLPQHRRVAQGARQVRHKMRGDHQSIMTGLHQQTGLP